MFRGLYTATTGMITNNKKMDAITNNLANVNTVAYKKDLVVSESFPEILMSKINTPFDFSSQKPFKGIEINQQEDNAYQVKTTAGFFRTKTPNGVSYQKEMYFTVNEEGYLSTYYKDTRGRKDTEAGYLVLGDKGPIYVGEGAFQIGDKGEVIVGGDTVDNLVMSAPPGVIGTLNSGILVNKVQVNHLQGQLYATENKLDMAIRGDGFFQVETPEGIRYTRDGRFKLNDFNELVTSEGYFVLGTDDIITIDGDEVAITESGEVMVDGEIVNQLDIINIDNRKDLRKEGSNLYYLAEGQELKTQPFTGQVLQGFLESANVQPIKEMVEMMTLYRNYETNQRIIRSYDETLSKAVNEVGRL